MPNESITTMTFPEWITWWQVDEVIECLPIQRVTSEELMHLAPKAYHSDGVDLDTVWHRLSDEAKADITGAHQKEHKGLD
jgi:hypothetical protein